MGSREKWQQFREEWAAADAAVERRLARQRARTDELLRKAAEPTGTCDQHGCDEPTYGNNRTCNTHIACM